MNPRCIIWTRETHVLKKIKHGERMQAKCPYCGLTFKGRIVSRMPASIKKKQDQGRKTIFLSKSGSLTFKCRGCGKIVILRKGKKR